MQKISECFMELFIGKIEKNGLEVEIISSGTDGIEFNLNNKTGDKCTVLNYRILINNRNLSLLTGERILSSWVFDENNTRKENELIVNDFLDIILKSFRFASDNGTSEDDDDTGNTDNTAFDTSKFMKKICSIFPEVKEKYSKIENEPENYPKFLNFIKENINPRINEILKIKKNKKISEKLFKHLTVSYAYGDEILRCIITMLIFNGIDNEKIETAKAYLVPTMKKVVDMSYKFKNKL
ncbi:MAG: hypothetical protein CfP315_0431 [Candidatus Improbicoccus pseudotrichonymphae]|uniref:DUF7674 domain-containing protein n=1 Tax=Candidatus Improbicoccus pseudotrichonymphae TaxID=3033792 RepID=A0AA48KX05_9FIRM|nr:MAG: hypothetical protein CfP315_0431 [Candidatus Improbicoccus pseudotrichonymphae]